MAFYTNAANLAMRYLMDADPTALAALAVALSLALSFAPYLVARARNHQENFLFLALNAAVAPLCFLWPVLGVAAWIAAAADGSASADGRGSAASSSRRTVT